MDCPNDIDCLDGVEFLEAFREKAIAQRVPLAGSMDLTYRCNLRCVHCYVSSSPDRSPAAGDEMDTGQVCRIIDECVAAGCLSFMLTGGEPMLRKDFPEIYRYAKYNGLYVTVFTNATLMDDGILDLFETLPPRGVEISLYGATEGTYEKITGQAGSFGRCIEGIEKLLARSVPVRLKTILMTHNADEFEKIEEMARQYDVEFRFDACIFNCLDGSDDPLSLRVSAEEAVEKDFSDKERAREWFEYFTEEMGDMSSDKLYGCGAGVTGFHINPYGQLQPCLMMPWMSYDLLTGKFSEGWQKMVDLVAGEKAPLGSPCRDCNRKNLCGYCPAFFRAETGSEKMRSEYLCSIGAGRYDRIMVRKE